MAKLGTQDALFRSGGRSNFRVVVTGQVGVHKKPFLDRLAQLAQSRNHPVRLFHVGDMMYADAPDVRPGRILDLPISRLNSLRRAVFKEILAEVGGDYTVIVNTHAAFRWKHGLFPAFDHDQMMKLDADMYITLVDNFDAVHERLNREHDIRHTLKDVLVWREEEILATEVLASAIRGHGCFYVVARGSDDTALESLYRLIFKPGTKKVYPSFPMTHVMDMPETLASINAFRAALAEHFVTFDPGAVDEKNILFAAAAAAERGESKLILKVNGREVPFDVAELNSVSKDIDAQIYARDFKMIDQSDMICSFIPEMPNGKPALSSGVERELQHAYEATRDVFVVWQPKAEPSPFITETATRVFATAEEALEYFQASGYISSFQRELGHASERRGKGGRK